MEFSPYNTNPREDKVIPATWVLLLLVLAILFGNLLGAAFSTLIGYLSGTDMRALLDSFGKDSPYGDRQLLRWLSLVTHVASFTLPVLGMAFLLYRKRWFYRLYLDAAPKLSAAATGILFILVSFPFAQTIYWINRQLPLPEWMTAMEGDVEGLVQGLLVMNSPGELLFNLLVVAIVPAIGEELVFRGVLQPQLLRMVRRPALAVWITAFLFSAVHMQFEGFLPRFLLGAMLGYLFLWSRNLWIPIIAHFFFNGLQVVVQFFAADAMNEMDTTKTDQPYWLLGGSSLLLTLYVGYYFYRRFSAAPTVPPENTEALENEEQA